jgi:hypothetical protein
MAYSVGDDMALERRSDLAEHDEISKEVREEAELLGEWIADTYGERGNRHRNASVYKNFATIQLDSSLGILDIEESVLRIPKIGNLTEEDKIDSALRLLGSEADEAQIIQQGEQIQTTEIDSGTAEDILDGTIDDILEDASRFYNSILEKSAYQIKDETGIQINDLRPYKYLELIHNSELKPESWSEVNEPKEGTKVTRFIEEGLSNERTFGDSKAYAANELSDRSGLLFPVDMSANRFLEMIEGSELANVDVEEVMIREVIKEAERISDSKQLYRDTDANGKRIYRWSQGSSYSVTTIIDPLPTSHKEIDTGAGLFHWQNIYDGSDGKYDSDIVRDYSGNRGTLAHEKVFAKYVDNEDEIKEILGNINTS